MQGVRAICVLNTQWVVQGPAYLLWSLSRGTRSRTASVRLLLDRNVPVCMCRACAVHVTNIKHLSWAAGHARDSRDLGIRIMADRGGTASTSGRGPSTADAAANGVQDGAETGPGTKRVRKQLVVGHHLML